MTPTTKSTVTAVNPLRPASTTVAPQQTTNELVTRLEALKAQVWSDTNLGLVELKDKFQELVAIIHAAFTAAPPANPTPPPPPVAQP
jgi:hypothetical protein